MTAAHSNPKIAHLRHQSATYRGEWKIHATTVLDSFTAFHEVMQPDGIPKVVEQICFPSLHETQSFTSYLISHGWRRTWPL